MPRCRREWREQRVGMSLVFADKAITTILTMISEEGLLICLRGTILFTDLASYTVPGLILVVGGIGTSR